MAIVEGSAAGVYIHLPFCARICPYCDFAVTVGSAEHQRRLTSAIEAEIARFGPDFGHPVDTLYFGGGTPSLLPAEDLARLSAAVGAALEVRADLEIFLEANPEDVDESTLAAWRDIGVTTLSLGVQSFDNDSLSFLGRRHDSEQARRAVSSALAVGFRTVSVDLIYGLPGQSVGDLEREIGWVAESGPDHVSCYQLTIHSGTPFARLAAAGRLAELSDSRQAALFVLLHEELAGSGWSAYEVSNFARADKYRSRHNQKYWSGVPYVGFGPAAHSYRDDSRWWNVADSRAYVERIESQESPRADGEALSPEGMLLESVMLGMRTTAGIDLEQLGERFEVDLVAPNRALLEGWRDRGWVALDGGRVMPSTMGLALADGLTVELALPTRPG